MAIECLLFEVCFLLQLSSELWELPSHHASSLNSQNWDNSCYNVIPFAWRAALLRINTLVGKNVTPEVPFIILRFPLIILGSRRLDRVAKLCGVMWERVGTFIWNSSHLYFGGGIPWMGKSVGSKKDRRRRERSQGEETGKRRGDEAWPAEQRVVTGLAHGLCVCVHVYGCVWVGGWLCVCVCVCVLHSQAQRDETIGSTVSGRLRWHLLLTHMSKQHMHTHIGLVIEPTLMNGFVCSAPYKSDKRRKKKTTNMSVLQKTDTRSNTLVTFYKYLP